MNRKFAFFEMAAAVVLFAGMVLCSISAWYHVNELFKSSRTSVTSCIVVVRDGRVIFDKFRPFFPRSATSLRSVGEGIGLLSKTCRWTSETLANIPLVGDKLAPAAKSFDDMHRDLVRLKVDLDNLAGVLRDMYDGQGYTDLCRAFENTETSLRKTDRALVEINRHICFMGLIALVVTGILCSGMFIHGWSHWRRS